MEKYAAHVIDRTRASGAPQAAIDAKVAEMGRMKEMYRKPFFRMAETFIEAFPVGLLFTLVSAALLRRKRDSASASTAGVSPLTQ
jgi:membrane protein CcdC involved in cytochrome C biogenesis